MKKAKKLSLKIFIIIMIFSLMFSINSPRIFADVGDFGTDWSDSDWDSDYSSSWDSDWDYDYDYDNDYDYDYDYSYSSGSDLELDLILALLFSGNGEVAFILFLFIVISAMTRKSRKRKSRVDWYTRNTIERERARRIEYIDYRYNSTTTRTTKYSNNNSLDGYFTTAHSSSSTINTAQSIEQEILKTDELFNREEFEAWVKQIFIKLQYAWTDRDWTEIRAVETNSLFEQHNTQLNRYITKKQINVLERVAVNWVRLHKFYKTAEKEVLEVALNSKMIDYVIDETTGKIIEGDKTTSRVRTYKLTFIRKIGVKSKPGELGAKAMNCPNCGGQLKITQAGKCEYCGSLVVLDDHGWALSELEPFNG